MSPRGFEAVGTPLCGLSVSSKSCCPATAPVCANTGAPLLGFRSPSAHDGIGYPYPGKVATTFPAPSALGVSHPLGGLLHPNPCKALKQRLSCESRCVPAALLGFPVLFRSSESCDPERATRVRVSSSRCSPPPRRTRCSPCPPFLRFVPVQQRSLPGGAARLKKRALQGFDRRRVGVSRSSEPLVPTVRRFLADLHTRELESSTRSSGLPRHVPARVTARHPATKKNFCDPAFYSLASLRHCLKTRQPTALSRSVIAGRVPATWRWRPIRDLTARSERIPGNPQSIPTPSTVR